MKKSLTYLFLTDACGYLLGCCLCSEKNEPAAITVTKGPIDKAPNYTTTIRSIIRHVEKLSGIVVRKLYTKYCNLTNDYRELQT